jgi:hypothetical protein
MEVGRIANGGRPLAGDTRVAIISPNVLDVRIGTYRRQEEAMLPYL